MRRGLSVTVAHPDPQRKPTELVLCDRMQTASFAIVAATMLRDSPSRDGGELGASGLPRPARAGALAQSATAAVVPAEAVRSGVLQASFDTGSGLRCTQLSVAGLEQALACAAAPIFEVSVSGESARGAGLVTREDREPGAGKRFILRHAQRSWRQPSSALPARPMNCSCE